MNEFKEKKKEQLIECSHDHYHNREDTVTLYQYGGAALHTMIEKLKKKSKHHPHLPLLFKMSSDIGVKSRWNDYYLFNITPISKCTLH